MNILYIAILLIPRLRQKHLSNALYATSHRMRFSSISELPFGLVVESKFMIVDGSSLDKNVVKLGR